MGEQADPFDPLIPLILKEVAHQRNRPHWFLGIEMTSQEHDPEPAPEKLSAGWVALDT